MNLDTMPILNGLIKYIEECNIPFHMPGHKSNANSFEELELIREKLYEIDKTEVPDLDNLHSPNGIILEGQKLAARSFKASKSFFLVNGSTCGIYSMIMGVTKPGDKVIIQRNCHRSVFMAALMGDIIIRCVEPEIIDEFNIPGGIELQALIAAMDENLDAKAVVITYPSYYGICSDMKAIVEEAHKRNMLVLVDEAHGAHLPFNNKLPRSSMELGADASVVSIHKSLPALTQASILNIGKNIDDKGIHFMLKVFQSTSPSYVLMASIDAARSIMDSRGEQLLDKLINNIEKFHSKLSLLKNYKVLDKGCIGKASVNNIDITKIVIFSEIGGRELEAKLRNEYNIQVEMSDINNVVLISSVGDAEIYFEKLYEALYNIDKGGKYFRTNNLYFKHSKNETSLSLRDAYYSNKISIKLNEAEGYISAEIVVPYPPGIPLILPGELITKENIEYLNLIKKAGIQISGMEDSQCENILVVGE